KKIVSLPPWPRSLLDVTRERGAGRTRDDERITRLVVRPATPVLGSSVLRRSPTKELVGFASSMIAQKYSHPSLSGPVSRGSSLVPAPVSTGGGSSVVATVTGSGGKGGGG